MGITTQKFVKKPLYVEAVRITQGNFSEVVKWCKGRVTTESDTSREHPGEKYIKLETHNPINARQTKAFVGDWLLKTQRGYKIYTDKAFTDSFDAAHRDRSVEAQVADLEEELDSCATPRALVDPSVPQ